ncbi:MAG: PEGA domain-containing protein [Calditrichaeota bacterium]|nr:MAG: PEGA domain-containing protein [Calditrichota bacterium]
MVRKATLVFWMALGCGLAFSSAMAQNDAKGRSRPGIVINSVPQGTLVYLKGEFEFYGRTPLVLPYRLYGKYNIKAHKKGYETVNTIYDFTGENGGTFLVKLKPKTRGKAFVRSLLFPGWGQYYSGRRGAGTFFVGATLAAFGMLAVQERQYRSAINEYDRALATFQQENGSYADQKRAFDALQDAIAKVENQRDARNLSLYAAGGIWLLNVLESVLFFPDFTSQVEFFQNFSVKPTTSDKGVGLAVKYQF